MSLTFTLPAALDLRRWLRPTSNEDKATVQRLRHSCPEWGEQIDAPVDQDGRCLYCVRKSGRIVNIPAGN